MKYQDKLNRYEKKTLNAKILEESLHGEGLYLYENNSDAQLTLPRPTKSGLRIIGARAQFQGDNYYMQLVRSGHLRFIKELESPEAQKTNLESKEETEVVAETEVATDQLNEVNMEKEEKLILDQPETVTTEGTVENVAAKPECSEGTKCDGKKPDVLLNEDPVDDGFLIIED